MNRVVRVGAGELSQPFSSGTSILVLSGNLRSEDDGAPLSAGDLVVSMRSGTRHRNDGSAAAFVLVDSAEPPIAGGESRRILRDELAGKPFPGITGIRALSTNPSGVAIRFGPPPGARWVVVGLRSMAVFVGKMTLIENDEPRDVAAGSLALVTDPTATLYVQAGNDAAVAVGFAAARVLVALG